MPMPCELVTNFYFMGHAALFRMHTPGHSTRMHAPVCPRLDPPWPVVNASADQFSAREPLLRATRERGPRKLSGRAR
jgi:hypothetical protein